MSSMNRLLAKTLIAAALIPARRIVKFNAEGGVLVSASSTDEHIAVSDTAGPVEAGIRCDVVVCGIAQIDAGAAIGWGKSVTADAQGRAILAAAGDTAIGYAFSDAEQADDIVDVVLARHVL